MILETGPNTEAIADTKALAEAIVAFKKRVTGPGCKGDELFKKITRAMSINYYPVSETKQAVKAFEKAFKVHTKFIYTNLAKPKILQLFGSLLIGKSVSVLDNNYFRNFLKFCRGEFTDLSKYGMQKINLRFPFPRRRDCWIYYPGRLSDLHNAFAKRVRETSPVGQKREAVTSLDNFFYDYVLPMRQKEHNKIVLSPIRVECGFDAGFINSIKIIQENRQ